MSRLSGSCHRAVILVVAAFAASCSSSPATTTPPPPPPPPPSVSTVTVTPATVALLPGQSAQLTAAAKDSAGNPVSGQVFAWSSTAPTVASVNSTGQVTAAAVGTASITAATGGRSGTASIAVGEATTIGAAGGTVTAAGGNVVLQLPPGALASSTAITVAPAAIPAGASGVVPGAMYEFGPTGTQFPNSITATIKYNPALLPNGTKAGDLHLYTWNGGNSWTRMPGTFVDTVNNTVTANIPHFSLFGPCGVFCSPQQPVTVPNLDFSTQTLVCHFFTLNQGATSQTCTGGLDGGSTPANVVLTARQICFLTCTLLPGNPFTATVTITDGSGGSCVGNCAVIFNWTIHVAANTPPDTYLLVLDAQASVGGSTYQAESPGFGVLVPAPGYTPTLSTLSLSIPQGGSSGATVNLLRNGGFGGPVGLAVDGLPNGATASFSPASTNGTSSAMTINVGASVAARDYNLTLRTSAAGFPDQLTPFSLTVTGSGFSVAATPPFINTAAGASGKTGLKVTRTGGFSGTINYAVSGLPMGLVAAVTASSVTDSSVLTITAGGSIATGDYPVVVTATSAGAATQLVNLTITVVPAGLVAVHLDFSACSPATMPVWAAYQDGAGAFTRLAIAGAAADFTLASSKAAVAFVFPNGSGFSTSVLYMTQAELQTYNSNGGLTAGCGNPTPPDKIVNVSAVGANDLYASMGGSSAGPIFPGFPSQLLHVASGTQDAFGFTLTGSFAQLGTPKAIVRRDQNIPSGGALAPFDYTTSEAFVPIAATATVNGGASVNASMQYLSVNNGVCIANTLYGSLAQQSGSIPIYGIPTFLQRLGDLHRFGAADPSGQSASVTFHTFGTQNLTFGGAIAPTVTATAGTVRLLSAAVTLPAAYVNVALAYVDAGSTGNSVSLSGSAGYFGGSGVVLAMPDFGSIGYLPAWGPPPSGTVNYNMLATSTNGFTSTPASLCADNLTVRSAIAHGVK